MKQIRLKDSIYVVKYCGSECPGRGYWHCFWGPSYPLNGFPKKCPLEEYQEESK